jgi:hypothetical protein
MTKTIVLSYFNSDINWIKDIPQEYEIIIYNKGTTPLIIDREIKEIKLENHGRESHSYIRYISDNYEKLSDITFFSQANPHEHISSFIDLLDITDSFWFSDLGYYYCYLDGTPTHPNLPISNFCKKINLSPPEKIYFKPNGIFSVKKENILNRPKFFYDNILNIIEHTNKHNENLESIGDNSYPWILERLWDLIFDLKDEKLYEKI